ncbi:MAG: glycosyl transferase [Anaerolineae bacterium]|nr:glycosyl transferase [Anaerolineae bacterium]
MSFGYFDDEQREYVITRPDTPMPWQNYLGNEGYFGIISNTAGGYSFYRDARLRRLTRYRYNNAPRDIGGRYLYLRDNANGAYWSPTWQPTFNDLEDYTCRHGMGYTTIQSTFSKVTAQVRYFVPQGANLEVWQVNVTNKRDTTADLSLFSFIEFCLWDANDDMTNFQRNFSIGEVEIENGVIYHKTEYRERRDHFAYFACSAPLVGFDTSRDEFLGVYNGADRPKVVEQGQSKNSIAHGWAPVGSHHVKLVLAPGETREINFVLGYHENPRDDKWEAPSVVNKKTVRPIIEHYLQTANINQAFEALRQYWDGLLGILQVETPDIHTNRMVNVWNAYQNMVTFNMSRSASGYESGIGRGMGFRDSNQDLLGFVHMIPERARERIIDIAATQFANGGAYHQYQPLTKRGNNAVGSNFNDDPLWLVLGVAAYIKESGDWAILDQPVTFDNEPGSEQPLYEHLRRSMQYTLDRLGPHGLPLIGRADWNDCLNLNTFSSEPGESFQTTTNKDGKVAESVFIAGLFNLAAADMADMAEARGLADEATQYRENAVKMDAVVKEQGWDGNWFLRAYNHFGEKVGSKECAEGRIFIEPQGICIMAGMGVDDGRATKALNAVREHLATPHGIMLQQPAYSDYHIELGEISSYPPGYKENAGIFCHTNPWIMIAEAVVGAGDNAYDYYMRINPSAREHISELHRCEPYVYAQMIAGKDAATHGEAKNSWLTGTAAWNYAAITQWILGIRPTLNGLEIAPVVPTTWQEFRATRQYRGATYSIHVNRAGKGNTVAISVDGKPIEGSVVPLQAADTTCQVEVTLR